MFAEYGAMYDNVRRVYFEAAPPAEPVGTEKTPPRELHVFAWSPTQRALVWADTEASLLGVIVTDSQGTDLVELWSRYQPQ